MERKFGPVRQVVIPTDFSETADRALEAGIAVAKAFGAATEIVHVSSPVVVLPPPLELVSLPSLFPDLPQRIEEGLQSRATRAREAGVSCETKVLEGPAHQEIVRHATETHADLIVIGTHGRTGLRHAVLGSVAERVVQRAPCPVLVVPVPKED